MQKVIYCLRLRLKSWQGEAGRSGGKEEFAWIAAPFEIREDGRHRRRVNPNKPTRLNLFDINKIGEKWAKQTHGH
jgi:hypothetical protein